MGKPSDVCFNNVRIILGGHPSELTRCLEKLLLTHGEISFIIYKERNLIHHRNFSVDVYSLNIENNPLSNVHHLGYSFFRNLAYSVCKDSLQQLHIIFQSALLTTEI